MHSNFKDIHIGAIILELTREKEIDVQRICKFLNRSAEEVQAMYESKDLGSDVLLLWSKLLEYDLFRVYSQHLILYAPVHSDKKKLRGGTRNEVPRFKKNIYTAEIIAFILGLIHTGEKTAGQVIKEYHIPKTTLNRWMQKYREQHEPGL